MANKYGGEWNKTRKEKKHANCREGKGIIFLFFYFYIPSVTTAFVYTHN
jgi:hypothetical protein